MRGGYTWGAMQGAMGTLDIYDSAGACETDAGVLLVLVRSWNVHIVPYALLGSGRHALIEGAPGLIGHRERIVVGG